MLRVVLIFIFPIIFVSYGNIERRKERDTVFCIINSDEMFTDSQHLSKAYFASGCFWCVEAIFESIEGVKEVISGYSGGEGNNPTYRSVSRGQTDHAESVEIYYNPDILTFEKLVVAFFDSHDPTQYHGQGPDKGRHYRSIAFYQNDIEKKIIEDRIKQIQKDYDKPIVTQVTRFRVFWKAEDYHQDYEKLNPNNPYIKSISIPRLEQFQNKHPEILKKRNID